MEFSTKVGRPETVKADAVVVGVHADGELTATAKALDTASGGALMLGDMSEATSPPAAHCASSMLATSRWK